MKNSKGAAEETILNELEDDELKQDDIKTPDGDEMTGEQAEPIEREETATKEEEELNTKYLRLAADFQNYRRRVEKEKNDIYAYANEKLMAELLNVIDNFDRALAVETVDTGMKDGMVMILKQLVDVLEKSGMEEIAAEGQDFDPNFHHAVQTVKSDEHGSGQVAKVLQKGYMLNTKVIRPAMVIVAE
jgi:molecular chaperone GrpE